MEIYVAIQICLCLLALMHQSSRLNFRNASLPFVFLAVFTGLRHNVGMDWNNYIAMQYKLSLLPTYDVLMSEEPGFKLILILSDNLGMLIYGANFLTAILFLASLFLFVSKLPFPWLGLAASFPYLIVVVSMSASRQMLSIAVLMLLISISIDNRIGFFWRYLIASFGVLFHLSSVIFFPFLFFSQPTKTFNKYLIGFPMIIVGAYYLLSSNASSHYQTNYLGDGAGVQSTGSLFHVSLIALPVVFVIFFAKSRFNAIYPSSLLRVLAFVSLTLLPLTLIFSTIASRLSMYCLPVFVVTFASLPLYVKPPRNAIYISSALFCFVLISWLGYANNSYAWLNYRNILFIGA